MLCCLCVLCVCVCPLVPHTRALCTHMPTQHTQTALHSGTQAHAAARLRPTGPRTGAHRHRHTPNSPFKFGV